MTPTHDPIEQALNPADYFTLAIDEALRQENMPGNLCGFGLELDQQPDVAELCNRILEFMHQFPLSNASLEQRGNRFFWRQCSEPHQLFYQHHCPPTESETFFFDSTINQIINQRTPREHLAPIEFHLLTGSHRHALLLRWYHPLCDARGAELILKYLCTDSTAQRNLFDQPKTTSLVQTQLAKYSWWQNFRFFWQAYRYIRRLDHYRSIQHRQSLDPPKRLHALTFRLTETQTRQVAEHSRQLTGLTGTSLYYIGCLMRALHKLDPDAPGEAYLAPYAFNLRKQKALTPLFGNHLGTLFAQAPKTLLDHREPLFAHLKAQYAQTLKQQLDQAFFPTMWAASFLPLKKHIKELRVSYKDGSERSSFWFSDIGQFESVDRNFFGADITGLFHLCQVTSPPGLGLLMCKYRDQLTLSYNFIEPLFNDNWIKQLHVLMSQELLGQ